MKLEGRRESTNVDDRRGGASIGTIGGLGIGGLIIVGLLTWLLGGDPSTVIQEAGQVLGGGAQTAEGYTPTAEEEELATFAKQILAGTEDVWSSIFKANGLTYQPPKLVQKDIDKREDHRLPPASFHAQSTYLLSCQSVSSVAQSCLTLCDPMDCRTPGFPVHHQLLDLVQTHDH